MVVLAGGDDGDVVGDVEVEVVGGGAAEVEGVVAGGEGLELGVGWVY